MAARTGGARFQRGGRASFVPRVAGRPPPHAMDGSRVWQAAWALLRALGRTAGAFAAELRARRAMNYLRSLDDDQLLDLGVRRHDIERFVRSRNDERWKPRTARFAPQQSVATARRVDGRKPDSL
jgi:uncharacterized protein YjiS (DUF1127 family)